VSTIASLRSYSRARPYWDQEETRDAVRKVFGKAMQCRTAELGAEVYASENQARIVYHTCKSRACPSCGHRATLQWQRERGAAVPDTLYKGITFTMPGALWELFRDNLQAGRLRTELASDHTEDLLTHLKKCWWNRFAAGDRVVSEWLPLCDDANTLNHPIELGFFLLFLLPDKGFRVFGIRIMSWRFSGCNSSSGGNTQKVLFPR